MDGIERLQKVIKWSQFGQTPFANETGISGPQLSNYLNRKRNQKNLSPKDSEKILRRFPDISEEWLVLGKGEMLTDTAKSHQPSLFAGESTNNSVSESYNEKLSAENKEEKLQTVLQPSLTNVLPHEIVKIVEREVPVSKSVTEIILYYSDGTFEKFHK